MYSFNTQAEKDDLFALCVEGYLNGDPVRLKIERDDGIPVGVFAQSGELFDWYDLTLPEARKVKNAARFRAKLL